MKRGVFSLAVISSAAPLLGIFGTVLGIANSFRSANGSRTTIMAMTAGFLSEAMLPTLLSLVVAIPAFWFYKYLRGRLEAFDVEMQTATAELINRLPLRTTSVHWPPLTLTAEPSGVIEPPRFRLRRMFPHGVLQLIWPRLESQLDADVILRAAMWVTVAYGLLGFLAYYWQSRTVSGIVILAFFSIAGRRVRAGSRLASFGLLAFLLFASAACLIPYRDTFTAALLAAASLLFVGSLKAARYVAAKPSKRFESLRNLLLLPLEICAIVAVLLGTSFALYATTDNQSMDPIIHRDDRIISLNVPLAAAFHRGELVAVNGWWASPILRVAGLPGDEIEVKSGKLIRNGQPVIEPYSQKPYRGTLSDFPAEERHYFVPEGYVFLLNDDRNELEDCRLFGSIPLDAIAAHPILAFNLYEPRWFLPRLIH